MIASLRGVLLHKGASEVIVECGGVGYGVTVSLSSLAAIGDVDAEVHLLIYTQVGEDVLRLFGFVEAHEKRAFELLVGLNGVGPKLALAVLSTYTAEALAEAIARGDVAALVRVPGVGKKKAERLLLELRDKFPASMASAGLGAATGAVSLLDDIVSALGNLGFPEAVCEKAARRALDDHPGEQQIATLVRAALQATTKPR